MRTSGLRTITSIQLALSAMVLSFLLSQLPIIIASLTSLLPSRVHPCLNQFDALFRNLSSHRSEVIAKLSAIIGGLIESSCSKLLTSHWAKLDDGNASAVDHDGSATHSGSHTLNAHYQPDLITKQDRNRNEPDPIIKTLMKQTAGLHRTLGDLLPAKDREVVFNEVSRLFSGMS